MKNVCIIMCFIALFLPGCSKEKPAQPVTEVVKKEIGVVTVEDASVRVDPFISSARIATLPTGANIEVIDKSKEQSRAAGKLDYWYRIRLSDGITGWIYGQNIRVFKEGEDSSVESFAKELRSEEAKVVQTQVIGKWWSVSAEESFTDHILSIRKDGTYASLLKGGSKPKDGTYEIDTANGAIVFSGGTTFGDKVNFVVRGEFVVIEAVNEDSTIKFKKISSDPDFKDELVVPEEPKIEGENSASKTE